jgi:phosphate-selective porin OprO and OprP
MRTQSILIVSTIIALVVIGTGGKKVLGAETATSAQPLLSSSESGMSHPSCPRNAILPQITDGICFKGEGLEGLSLCLGAFFQMDYRYFDYEDVDPDKNKFDIRRAQLKVSGDYLDRFSYFFKYEFEGAGSRRLLDAGLDIDRLPYLSIKAGQFKEPFGLDSSTADSNLFFAERSMGYYLAPNRDLGVMASAPATDGRFWCGIGIFNGDGEDDSTGGNEDAPQFVGRLAAAPFKGFGSEWLEGLHLGGSFGYADIDSNNVDITVKTSGLTTFLDVATRAKFNIIRDAGELTLYGLECGYVLGPLALATEYTAKSYSDIETSSETFDTDLDDFYVALAWMITGEHITIKNGVFQPLEPGKTSPVWGAVGLALRYDRFAADDHVYDNLIIAGSSVREATAYSLAASWYINRFTRLTLDATQTEFDRPLIIDRDDVNGTALYDDSETVVTARLSFDL